MEVTLLHMLVHMYYFLEMYIYLYCQESKIRSYILFCEQQYEFGEFTANEEKNSSLDSNININQNEVYSPLVEMSELEDQSQNLLQELQEELANFDFGEELEESIEVEQRSEVELIAQSYASAKISDNLLGPQQWVVTIVGMEETYIHVSDGHRIWINVGEKAHKLSQGDMLILDVFRTEKTVQIENLFLIETDITTEEYIIPDEDYHFYRETAI